MEVETKRAYKVQQGQQCRISSDKLVSSIQKGACYTHIYIRYNVLLSRKLWYLATLW